MTPYLLASALALTALLPMRQAYAVLILVLAATIIVTAKVADAHEPCAADIAPPIYQTTTAHHANHAHAHDYRKHRHHHEHHYPPTYYKRPPSAADIAYERMIQRPR